MNIIEVSYKLLRGRNLMYAVFLQYLLALSPQPPSVFSADLKRIIIIKSLHSIRTDF